MQIVQLSQKWWNGCSCDKVHLVCMTRHPCGLSRGWSSTDPTSLPAHPRVIAREMVRRKAVMVMHHFYLRSASSVAHLDEDFRRMLGDTDPGVMEGTLVLFHQLVKVGAGQGWNRSEEGSVKGITVCGLYFPIFSKCDVMYVVQCLYKVEIHMTSPLPLPFPPLSSPPVSSPLLSRPAGQVQADGPYLCQLAAVCSWLSAAEGDGVPRSPRPLSADQTAEDTGHLGSRGPEVGGVARAQLIIVARMTDNC